jgi:hypothetical protein
MEYTSRLLLLAVGNIALAVASVVTECRDSKVEGRTRQIVAGHLVANAHWTQLLEVGTAQVN